MASVQEQPRCTFPGCDRSRTPPPPNAGRPSTYCVGPGHNAAAAFRARRAGAQEAEAETSQGSSASLAGMRLRSVAEQVGDELAGHRRRLEQLVETALTSFDEAGDPAAVEAELAAMRAEMLRTVGDSDAALAAERRDRAAAEGRAAQAEQLRDTAEAASAAVQLEVEDATAEAARAREAAAEHQALAAAAVAREEAATAAREAAEDRTRQARAEQTTAERETAAAIEASARAEAAREQAERRSAESAGEARAAIEQAEAAITREARAASDAADANRRADVAEQRVRDSDQLRALAEERTADYRVQLDEHRQREAARSDEIRERLTELHARIEELALARQREADRADTAERRASQPSEERPHNS